MRSFESYTNAAFDNINKIKKIAEISHLEIIETQEELKKLRVEKIAYRLRPRFTIGKKQLPALD